MAASLLPINKVKGAWELLMARKEVGRALGQGLSYACMFKLE